MNLSRNDKIFTATILLLLFLFSFLYYYHTGNSLEPSLGEKKMGKLILKNNIAMRKFSGRLAWDDIDQESDVYSNDSILTGKESLADLVLDDDFRLEIQDESLIELEMVDGKLLIKLNSGKLKFSGTASENVSVQTSDGNRVNLNRARGEIKLGPQGMSMKLSQGNAVFEDSKGETRKVTKDEELHYAKGTAKVSEVQVTTSQKPSESILKTSTGNKSVTLQWQGVDDARLEISNNATMQNSQVYRVSGNQKTLNLPAGTWYWQVRSEDKKLVSSVEKIRILNTEPVKVLYPPKGFVSDQNDILFRWSGPRQNYHFVLYENKKKVREYNTYANRVSLNLPPSLYRYKLSWQSDGKENSETDVFEIIKKLETTVKILKRNQDFKEEQIKKEGVTLSWQKFQGAREYEVQVSRGRYFKKKVTTTNPRAVLKNLKPGTYKWKVVAIINDEQKSTASTPGKFTIIETPIITALSPPDGYSTALKPENNMAFVLFKWKSNKGKKFRISFSQDREFSKVELTHQTRNESFLLPGLTSGRHYWKVERLDNEKVVAETAVRYFYIRGLLPRPAGLHPPDKKEVILEAKNELQFSWSRVSSATDYQVRIYQRKENNALDLIQEKITKGTSLTIRDLPRFAQGKLYWEVTALVKKNGNVVRNGETAFANCTINYGRAPSLIKARPGKIRID